MKKIISLFICASIILSLCACGSRAGKENAEAGLDSYTPTDYEPSGEMVYTVDIFHTDSKIIEPRFYSSEHGILLADTKLMQGDLAYYEIGKDGKIIREITEDELMASVSGSALCGHVYMESQENKGERYIDYQIYSDLSGQTQQLLSFRMEQGTADMYLGKNCLIIMTQYWDSANNGHYEMKVYDTSGKLLKAQELYEWYDVYTLPEGIYFFGRDNHEIYLFDEAALEFTKKDRLDDDFIWGGISCGYIYMFDQENYCRRKFGESERQLIFNFDEMSLNPGPGIILEGGESFLFPDHKSEFNPYKIVHLVDKNSLPKGVNTITLAVNFNPGAYYNYDSVIRDFCIEHKQYRIELKNYSNYPDPEETLGADIASGSSPDMIDLAGFENAVVNPSVCEDLMPYIIRDFDESSFLAAPLEAMKTGGRLLSIAPSFKLVFLAGPSGLMPEKGIRSWGELAELAGGPENVFGPTLYREDFMLCAFSNSLRNYSEEEVADALRFAAELPCSPAPIGESQEEINAYFQKVEAGEIVDDMLISIRNGMQTFALCECDEFVFSMRADYVGELSRNVGIVELEAAFGAPYRVSGLPAGGENSSFLMRPCNEFSMLNGSENKDAAWEFMKLLLQDQYLVGQWELIEGIPVIRSAYELYMDKVQSNINGTISNRGDSSGSWEYHYNPDYCLNLYEYMLSNVSGVLRDGDGIFLTISQLAEGYFSGDMELSDVSADIASRLRTYNAERG